MRITAFSVAVLDCDQGVMGLYLFGWLELLINSKIKSRKGQGAGVAKAEYLARMINSTS